MNRTSSRLVRYWFFAGALMVFLILVVGGITRLTQSGLSIVEWEPISGILPPLSEAAWEAEFDRYRQFPEYQQLNRGMSMSEFKIIYFWEYLHRILARGIGLVFIIPFVWFASRRMLSARQLKQSMLLFGLGFLQGFMGWFMVQSGLVDVPYISPFRLAAHLLLAFLIFTGCMWFAMEAWPRMNRSVLKLSSRYKALLLMVGLLLLLQIAWGAFVAGHKAGYFYNTFPTMNGYWFPPQLLDLQPAWVNFFQNIVAVQWTHRVLGTLLLLATLWLVFASRRVQDPILKISVYVFGGLMTAQYLLGIFTLLYRVPISLGVLHQAVALLLVGALLFSAYRATAAGNSALANRN